MCDFKSHWLKDWEGAIRNCLVNYTTKAGCLNSPKASWWEDLRCKLFIWEMNERTGREWQKGKGYHGCCGGQRALMTLGFWEAYGVSPGLSFGKHFSRSPWPIGWGLPSQLEHGLSGLLHFQRKSWGRKAENWPEIHGTFCQNVAEIRSGLRGCDMGAKKSPIMFSTLCPCGLYRKGSVV